MKLLWHMPTLRRTSCGLSIRALNFAERLRTLGHEITFAVARDKTDCVNDEIDGIPIQRLDCDRKPPIHWSFQSIERRRSARDAVSNITGHFDAILSCQPEAIVAFRERLSRGPTRACPQDTRVPLIFVCGGTTLLHDEADRVRARNGVTPVRRILSAPAFAVDRLLKRSNEKTAFESADICVLDSESTRDRVISGYGVSPPKCHAIRGAVDTHAFRPPTTAEHRAARRQFEITDDEFAIAWTGRMSVEKNLGPLLQAVPLCRHPRVRLLLAGDGPERPYLEKIAAEFSESTAHESGHARLADRVQFLREISDVRPLLHAADAFAFPSISESLGLSLVEAMACGLPAIALAADDRHIRNASREIFGDTHCGLLVDRNDASAFAEAIDRLAQSPEERAAIADAVRRRAESEFDWRQATQQLESLITEGNCRLIEEAIPISTRASHAPRRGARIAEATAESLPVESK